MDPGRGGGEVVHGLCQFGAHSGVFVLQERDLGALAGVYFDAFVSAALGWVGVVGEVCALAEVLESGDVVTAVSELGVELAVLCEGGAVLGAVVLQVRHSG